MTGRTPAATGGAHCAAGTGLAAGRRPGASALALLGEARGRLREAAGFADPRDRYAAAHVAALRVAAAVLAARGSPLASPSPPRRRRPVNAWVQLAAAAPELVGWAEFFAANAGKRAAAEAGVRDAATDREAAELLGLVWTFLAVVETTLGLAPRSTAARAHRPAPPGRARRPPAGSTGTGQPVGCRRA